MNPVRTLPPCLPQVHMVLRPEQSSLGAPSQAWGEPSSPRFRHFHGQCPSCQVSALFFPEELTEQQKPDSVIRKEGGAGLRGVNRSDRSHFPVSPHLPPSQPYSELSFGCDSCTPTRGASEVTCCSWSSPCPALERLCEHSRPGRTTGTFLSVVSEPFIPPRGRGLRAEVSGLRSPPCPSGLRSRGSGPPTSLGASTSLGAYVAGPRPTPQGQRLGAPVPLRPLGPRS